MVYAFKKKIPVCKSMGCNNLPVDSASEYCSDCFRLKQKRKDLIEASKVKARRHWLTNIKIGMKTAHCDLCGVVKIYRRRDGETGDDPQELPVICQNARAIHDKLLKRLRVVGRKTVMAKACSVCGSTSKLHYDHCHITELYRRTLCHLCNKGEGFLRSNPDIMVELALQTLAFMCPKTDPSLPIEEKLKEFRRSLGEDPNKPFLGACNKKGRMHPMLKVKNEPDWDEDALLEMEEARREEEEERKIPTPVPKAAQPKRPGFLDLLSPKPGSVMVPKTKEHVVSANKKIPTPTRPGFLALLKSKKPKT